MAFAPETGDCFTGLGEVVDQAVPIQLLDALGGEGRASTVAQQPFAPAPIVGRDAHRRVQGEPAAVAPLFHVPALVLVQDPAPYESAQDALAEPSLHRRGIVRIQLIHCDESYPVVRIGLEYPVDDANMKVRMLVERGAEAVNEGNRAGARLRANINSKPKY